LFSTGNTVLLLLLATSRLIYGMASEKTLPRILGQTHEHQPRNALLVALVATILLSFVGGISFLAHATDALLFSVFAVMNGVVIKLNWSEKKTHGKNSFFRVPLKWGKIPIPSVIGLVASIAMLWFVERDALQFGFALVLIGVVVHYAFSQKKKGWGKAMEKDNPITFP
jgi:APA family basic amino acid/polyamine antiporter